MGRAVVAAAAGVADGLVMQRRRPDGVGARGGGGGDHEGAAFAHEARGVTMTPPVQAETVRRAVRKTGDRERVSEVGVPDELEGTARMLSVEDVALVLVRLAQRRPSQRDPSVTGRSAKGRRGRRGHTMRPSADTVVAIQAVHPAHPHPVVRVVGQLLDDVRGSSARMPGIHPPRRHVVGADDGRARGDIPHKRRGVVDLIARGPLNRRPPQGELLVAERDAQPARGRVVRPRRRAGGVGEGTRHGDGAHPHPVLDAIVEAGQRERGFRRRAACVRIHPAHGRVHRARSCRAVGHRARARPRRRGVVQLIAEDRPRRPGPGQVQRPVARGDRQAPRGCDALRRARAVDPGAGAGCVLRAHPHPVGCAGEQGRYRLRRRRAAAADGLPALIEAPASRADRRAVGHRALARLRRPRVVHVVARHRPRRRRPREAQPRGARGDRQVGGGVGHPPLDVHLVSLSRGGVLRDDRHRQAGLAHGQREGRSRRAAGQRHRQLARPAELDRGVRLVHRRRELHVRNRARHRRRVLRRRRVERRAQRQRAVRAVRARGHARRQGAQRRVRGLRVRRCGGEQAERAEQQPERGKETDKAGAGTPGARVRPGAAPRRNRRAGRGGGGRLRRVGRTPGARHAAGPPGRRAAGPPGRRAAGPPGRRAAGPPGRRAAGQLYRPQREPVSRAESKTCQSKAGNRHRSRTAPASWRLLRWRTWLCGRRLKLPHRRWSRWWSGLAWVCPR